MKVTMYVLKNEATGVYILTYKTSGKFHRLEHQRGKISEKQFKALMQVVPPELQELEQYVKDFPQVTYEVQKQTSGTKSLFKTLLDKYHLWYQQRTGIAPRIDGVTGASLNKIIAWLRQQSVDDAEVEQSFQLILDNWSNLPDFYQKQIELRQINSNLNIILNHVKNGKSDSKSHSASIADDFRKSL